MTARIKIRRDSAASWSNNNPILAAGELGLDTDVNQIKVGDGVTNWNTLTYINATGGFDGTSDLIFQSEDVGFYTLALPTYHWGSSQFRAVSMDSNGTGDVANQVYTVGTYYDQDFGRGRMFVSKRNADDTLAWKVAVTGDNGYDPEPYTITFDAVSDKLYVAGQIYDAGDSYNWVSFILELDTSNGNILSQTKYWGYDGSHPEIKDLLVDSPTGNVVAVGSVWTAPRRTVVTPVDASGTNPIQSYSTNGQDLDPDYSLLVFAKTDFDTAGYYPDNRAQWRLVDHNNAGDNGRNCDRINEFRGLHTVTETGTGAGVTVNLKYDIGQNKWIQADYQGNDGNPTWEYKIGDKVRVLGSAFGGTDGVDDIVLTVRYESAGGGNYLDFVDIENQPSTPTPPAVVTDYARIWFYGYVNFSQSVGDSTTWDIARQEWGNGFILTANNQLLLETGGGSDAIRSGDVYDDGVDSYVYAGGFLDSQEPEALSNRAVIYKVKISDGTQVWGKTIDMKTSDGNSGDYVTSLACDNNGNVYISSEGYAEDGNYGVFLTKLDANGDMQWQTRGDPTAGNWDNSPKLDYDLVNDCLYLGGDGGSGMRIIAIDPANGSTLWGRSIDFAQGNYAFNIPDNNSQFFAVGDGRIAVGGYSWDWNSTYNGGEQFGVMAGLDVGMMVSSEDETGTNGALTLSVDFWHTTSGTGSGSSRPLNSKFDLKEGTDVSSGAFAQITGAVINIDLDNTNILRNPYTIQNVKSITFADGTTQSSASVGIKHKWKNPNGNTWKIAEWNDGKALNYNQYDNTAYQYFNAKISATDVDFFMLDILNTDPVWAAFDNQNKPNLKVWWNGWEYSIDGWSTDTNGYMRIDLDIPPGHPLVSYGQGDSIQFYWNDPTSLRPVVWFDPSNSPFGYQDFRGATIHYHAYSDNVGGTITGTITYAYDCGVTEQATHTEHFAGRSNGQFVNFWNLDSDGRLSYSNSIKETDYVMIQWTATMFYGSEYYC